MRDCCVNNFLFFCILFLTMFCNTDCRKDIHKITINHESFYVYDSIPENKKTDRTFVVLPSYSYFNFDFSTKNITGIYSPHDDFEPLVMGLCKRGHRVIVVEYYGYNKSDDTDRSRSSEDICEEIHTALQKLNVDKYVLIPHSISGLYVLDYLSRSKYKNEVCGVVGIDMSLPYFWLEEFKSNEEYKKYPFKDKDKVTKAFCNQYDHFWTISRNLKCFKLNEKLHVLLFISSSLIEYIDQEIHNGVLKTRVQSYLNSIITNTDIQHINMLNGSHFLHRDQTKVMVDEIDKFTQCFDN